MDCETLSKVIQYAYPFHFVLAIVILSVLSFTIRRKNLGHGCCYSRPGLYSMVDLLHHGPNLLVYAAIFGAMSNYFLSLAFGLSGSVSTLVCRNITNPYGNIFCSVALSKVMLILRLGLLYGPLFVCVNASRRLLGHITGLLYLLYLIVTLELENVYTIYGGCRKDDDTLKNVLFSLLVLESLPSHFFNIALIIWFLFQIVVQDIVFKMRGVYISRAHKKNAYLINYTRNLLRKSGHVSVHNRWIKYIWIYEKGFRFPLKFLAPLVVMISLNYKLFIFIMSYAYVFSRIVDPWIEMYVDLTNVTLILSIMSGLVAMVLCGFLLLHLVATVHKHLKLAAQGKFKIFSKTLPSHEKILVFSLRYSGHQIGYFVWAWLILWIMAFVILGLVIALFVALKKYPDVVGPRVFHIGLMLAWIPLILVINRVMCKFVFLEKESRGKFIAITNMNGFKIFSYFMFLYNAIVGFVSAIIRVLLSMLFGTLLLFRLDQNIMMDGFKFADLGHKMYLGFLYVEHTYNNPVVNTFVALLVDEVDKREGENRESGPLKLKESHKGSLQSQFQPVEVPLLEPLIHGSADSPIKRSRMTRNRWLVAYTLINNPSLCPLRASQLQSKDNNHSTQLEGRNKDYPTGLESKTSEYPMLTSDYSTLSSEYPSQSNVYSTQVQTREY